MKLACNISFSSGIGEARTQTRVCPKSENILFFVVFYTLLSDSVNKHCLFKDKMKIYKMAFIMCMLLITHTYATLLDRISDTTMNKGGGILTFDSGERRDTFQRNTSSDYKKYSYLITTYL